MRKNQNGFSAVEALIVILLVAIIGLVGWYVWQHNDSDKNTDQAKPSKLEYVSYDNGLGQKYKLKFYSKYKVTKSPVADTTSSPSESSAKGVGLGSGIAINENLPIWLAIASEDLASLDETGKAQIENGKNCASNGFSKAFTVHNDFIDQDINVCYASSRDGNKKAANIALFTCKDQLHVISITANKKSEAGQPVATTDFEAYSSDLKKIISSIKIIKD